MAGHLLAWRRRRLTGDHESARARYEQVLHLGAASEGDLARHWAVPDLAALLLGLGDVAGATAVIEPAIADFKNEPTLIRVPFLLVLGEWQIASGDEEAAYGSFEDARQSASRIGNEPLTAQANYHLGKLARRQAEIAQAEDFHHQALPMFPRNRLVPWLVECLESLAGIAADQESAAEAVRLFASADAIRTSIGFVRLPVAQTCYERDLDRAREQLDEGAFATAWAEGDALTIDAVVAYASRARGERKRPSSGWPSLTPTELEVVKLTAKGLSNPEIAERLFVGRATVKTHLSHIFTKLGVTSRAELASDATRRGL